MSYEPSDRSKGLSGYAPPPGASYEWCAGYGTYQASAPPSTARPSDLSASTSYSAGGATDALDWLQMAVGAEALVLGWATALGCVFLSELGLLISFLLGIAVGVGNFFLGTRAIYWMLAPRMLACVWVGAVIVRTTSDGGADIVWQIFFGAIPAGLIAWNAVLAKRE